MMSVPSRMSFLDSNQFDTAPVTVEPFPHLVVERFVCATQLTKIGRDFPDVGGPGSYPVDVLDYGPAFGDFLAELESPEWTTRFARKFGVELSNRPTMVTVRGICRPKDGRIHSDSHSKLVTALIYLNDQWSADGGRLRLLRAADDLDDYLVEVPPVAGNLVAFVNADNAWHGHLPCTGVRRSLQLNWVRDPATVRRELARHRVSARVKRVLALFKESGR